MAYGKRKAKIATAVCKENGMLKRKIATVAGGSVSGKGYETGDSAFEHVPGFAEEADKDNEVVGNAEPDVVRLGPCRPPRSLSPSGSVSTGCKCDGSVGHVDYGSQIESKTLANQPACRYV